MNVAEYPRVHPGRSCIFDELHSSPFFEVQSPAQLFSFALFFDEDNGEQWHAVNRLAIAMGLTCPVEGMRYFSSGTEKVKIYWSLHTEFARYTFVLTGNVLDMPVSDIACAIPPDWLRSLSGQIIAAMQFVIVPESYPFWDALKANWFGQNRLIGGEIGEGRGQAYTDYRLHPVGFMDGGVTRYVVVDLEMGPRQTGRMVQRLAEVDTYVSLALLSLPLAKRQMLDLDVLGVALRQLIELMEREELRDEGLLKQLENLAAELERHIAESQYRFSASHAYYKLVESQMAELEGVLVPGVQSFKQFIWRRFGPAMMTCSTVERRQDRLAQRIQRTTALLRTRVEVTHEQQNRELLAGMVRRAELQLRLQETVEGLSIWVLSYYAVALLSHVLKALKIYGLVVNTELVTGASVPVIALLFWHSMRATKKKYSNFHAIEPRVAS